MTAPVGYLVNKPGGGQGEAGEYYDYLVAGNGVFIEASSNLLRATAPVAECRIRGLADVIPEVVLMHGLIPAGLVNLVIDALLAVSDKEAYIGIRWHEGQYRLYFPEQERSTGSVQFTQGENIVMDLHSHGRMSAFFSGQDDRDEQGLRLYAVVGMRKGAPEMRLRVGVYGHWLAIRPEQVIAGPVNIAVAGEEVDDHDL